MVLAFIAALQIGPGSQCPVVDPQKSIMVGWHDEFTTSRRWSPLNIDNKASVELGRGDVLGLTLGHVPDGWPYTFQWSGVTRDLRIDAARFPILMAHVPSVQGYAHMDVDVLDARGKSVRTLRSTTLNAKGISSLDLAQELHPATYNLRLRLIVGGPNEGCHADYDWVRFVKREDAAFLTAHPDFRNVEL